VENYPQPNLHEFGEQIELQLKDLKKNAFLIANLERGVF